MNYWLLKSEGGCYSIDDLRRDKKTAWSGIRNYQARNFMRDSMKPGDLCLFYHSSSDPTGVFGIAKVASAANPDLTAQDKKDDHYDPKATKENPIWVCPDIQFVSKAKWPLSLYEIKKDPDLKGMLVREQGSRLSVQPVSEKHFFHIQSRLVN